MGKYKYHFLMHAIILVWGFTGILGKLIHLSPEVIVWYRMIIATIGLAILLPFFKTSFRLTNKKDIWKLIFVGIITSLHWFTFFKAISLSTASLGVLCLSTATIHVAWLDPVIMKRKFLWSELVFGIMVIYGIYFVASDFKGDEYIALAYGLTSALLAAIFSVSNAKLVQTIPSFQISIYEMLTGAVFFTLILFFNNQFTVGELSMRTTDFWWLIFLGIVCTSLPFALMIDVVKRLGAYTASLSINLEPVYAIVLAVFILNENELLGASFYVGSTLIVCVVILNSIVKSRQRRKINRSKFKLT